jgi:cystathionine beta-lyase
MDPLDLEAQISSRTRLVWVEAAGSVTLEFPDLAALVRICKKRGVTVALDNTWGAGLAFKPFDLVPGEVPALGVDISAHALTKYPSGGGDVLMGSVITRDATRQLAQWCQAQPQFLQVLHPALQDSPGHAHWKKLCVNGMGGAAGLFSVVIDPRYTQGQCDAFCDALRLFRIGYSWGGPVSLVVPYDLASMRSSWPSHLAHGTLVRFAVGLEAVADLQADLATALSVALI